MEKGGVGPTPVCHVDIGMPCPGLLLVHPCFKFVSSLVAVIVRVFVSMSLSHPLS